MLTNASTRNTLLVGGLLLATSVVRAEFNGVRFEPLIFGPGGTITCRAIANFTDPGDSPGAVYGTADFPLEFSTPVGSGLLNQDAGSPQPHVPHAANGPYDTWFTIGYTDNVVAEVAFSPAAPGCPFLPDGCTGFANFLESYFLTAGPTVAAAFDPGGNAVDGWDVTIAQFTIKDEGWRFPLVYSGNLFYLENGVTPTEVRFAVRLCEDPCPADTNGDNLVNFADVLVVLGNWGCTEPPGPCPGDVDGNGVVDFGDVLAVISAWGHCYPV